MEDQGTTSSRPGPRRRRGIGPFSLRQVALAVGTVAIAAVVLMAITTPLGSTGPSVVNPNATFFPIRSAVPGLEVGSRAPEFEVRLDDGTTFQLADLDGRPIRLSDLRGKVVWVNFWATWCPPCQSETPMMRDVHRAYRDRGLELVAVDVQETVEVARSYAERYGLEYTIGADVSAHVFRQYRVHGLPTQLFIDPDGIIRYIVLGPLTAEAASQRIESLLPDRPPSPSPSR